MRRSGLAAATGLFLLGSTASFGRTGPVGAPARFRYQRAASLPAPGAQRLAVDLPLLVGSTPFRVESWPGRREAPPRRVARGGLSDLRFYDAHGRELPYLLVEPPSSEPEWRRAAMLLPIPATKKESGFEADLGAATIVDRLRLEGLPAPFLKRLALDGSGDRRHWTRLAAETTLFDLPDSGLRQLELAFPPGLLRYLRVVWDDSSSARVPLPRTAAARNVRPDAPARTTMSAPVAFERRPSEPGMSRFHLRLPAAALPVIALRLSVGGGNLMRSARVSEARLVGDGAAPSRLGEAVLKRAVLDVLAAEELRIPVEPPLTAQLEIEVEDGDNPPLELRAVEAELAELPWIYLEAAEAGPVVARWGQPQLEAPRYDLESARARAAQSAPPAGAWGQLIAPPVEAGALEAPAVLPDTGPPLETQRFHFARTLSEGPPGLVAVPLDAAVLAHSSKRLGGPFADLRVVDATGRQLPYLLDRRAEPLVAALPPAVPAEVPDLRLPAGTSVYRLTLPYPDLPPARLVLYTSARVFEREVRLLATPVPGDRRRRRAAETVAVATWRHATPETSASALTLSVPSLGTSDVLLAVFDGDNSALPLAAAELLLPAWHVRLFRRAPGELRVLYGRDDLASPRYDLALLAPTVLASPALEAALSAEQVTARSEPVILQPGAFWALMLAAVVVLLLLIARLVRKGP